MKGMIFTEFLEMLEEQHGLALKHQVIRDSRVADGGAYTSVGNYSHADLVALVSALETATGRPAHALLSMFGERLFAYFVRNYAHFFRSAAGCFEFLSRVEDYYIHVEVRKLYSDAQLPVFRTLHHESGRLIMEYQSPRPLAAFAEGLIRASIAHFKEPIALTVEDLSSGQGTSARFTLEREAPRG